MQIRNMMRHFLYALLFCLITTGAFAATPATPTNMAVQQMRDGNGQQYFHVTFTAQNPDSSAFYFITRWNGMVPDTSNRTTVGEYLQPDGNGQYSYNDYGSGEDFNPTHTSSDGYTWTYSYAAYGVGYARGSQDSIQNGAMSAIVSGTLDSVYLYFSNVPNPNITAHIGDTVTWTFAAQVADAASETVTYSASSGDSTVATAAIDQSGKFSSVVVGYGSTGITVKGTDAKGRSALCSFTINVDPFYDTLTVILRDISTNALLPENTEYYYSLSNTSAGIDTIYSGDSIRIIRVGDSSNIYGLGQLNSSGAFTITFPVPTSTAYMRVSAEGYNAALTINPLEDSINASARKGSYTLELSAAATHTISGKAADILNKPMSGVSVTVWRLGVGYDYTDVYSIGSTTTDANGNYQLTVTEGDSILGTNDVDVNATVSGYNDGNQSSGPISSLEDHNNVNFQFRSKQGGEYVRCNIETPSGNTITAYTTVTAYLLSDSGAAAAAAVTEVEDSSFGWGSMYLSPGKYVLFAQADTGYQSGYYSANGYAATWTQADTITITGRDSITWDTLVIVLQPDSSIAQQGSNSHIDGIVYDQSGNVAANAHLLLYQQISAPAGGKSSRLLYTTTASASGDYSFTKLSAGTYMVLVDIVGKHLFESGTITIANDTQSVTQNITYSPEAVNEGAPTMPLHMDLAQNYPNPFSQASDIAFTVPGVGTHVTLRVYNDMGRAMGTVAEGMYAQGQYIVHVDASAFPAGVYDYVLNMNGKTEA